MRTRSGVISILAVVLVTACFAPVDARASSRSSAMAYVIRSHVAALEMYQRDHGVLPAPDSGWFDVLLAGEYESDQTIFGLDPETNVPLDAFNRPLVYEIHATASGLAPVLRSVGANGIDERGAGDDWDSRTGPNWGHWYKSGWTAFIVISVLAGITVIGVGAALFRWVADRAAALGSLMLFNAAIFGLLVPILTGSGTVRSSASGAPRTLDTMMEVSFMLGPLGVMCLIPACARTARSALRRQAGSCPACGYDRSESDAPRCPECGFRPAEG